MSGATIPPVTPLCQSLSSPHSALTVPGDVCALVPLSFSCLELGVLLLLPSACAWLPPVWLIICFSQQSIIIL